MNLEGPGQKPGCMPCTDKRGCDWVELYDGKDNHANLIGTYSGHHLVNSIQFSLFLSLTLSLSHTHTHTPSRTHARTHAHAARFLLHGLVLCLLAHHDTIH